MKIISYNVNGLKSCISKGLNNFLSSKEFDILCLQEIKCADELLKLDNFYSYYNYYGNGGYSGTAVFTKVKPTSVKYKIENINLNLESRIIILEYKKFYLVNVYVPNSKSDNTRVNYRLDFDEVFYDYLMKLDRKKPIIVCGDFNVSLNYNDEDNFCDDCEIDYFNDFLDKGFIDTYGEIHNDEKYTWFFSSRNIGYRLDYFIVSDYLFNYVNDSTIFDNINCSDHLPILLDMEYKLE